MSPDKDPQENPHWISESQDSVYQFREEKGQGEFDFSADVDDEIDMPEAGDPVQNEEDKSQAESDSITERVFGAVTEVEEKLANSEYTKKELEAFARQHGLVFAPLGYVIERVSRIPGNDERVWKNKGFRPASRAAKEGVKKGKELFAESERQIGAYRSREEELDVESLALAISAVSRQPGVDEQLVTAQVHALLLEDGPGHSPELERFIRITEALVARGRQMWKRAEDVDQRVVWGPELLLKIYNRKIDIAKEQDPSQVFSLKKRRDDIWRADSYETR